MTSLSRISPCSRGDSDASGCRRASRPSLTIARAGAGPLAPHQAALDTATPPPAAHACVVAGSRLQPRALQARPASHGRGITGAQALQGQFQLPVAATRMCPLAAQVRAAQTFTPSDSQPRHSESSAVRVASEALPHTQACPGTVSDRPSLTRRVPAATFQLSGRPCPRTGRCRHPGRNPVAPPQQPPPASSEPQPLRCDTSCIIESSSAL
jgi:hypothetical protein